MGQNWGRNLREHADVEIGGWVDVKPGAAADAADKLELAGVHTGEDLGQALAEVKPDFVVDVTIPDSHHNVTLQALAAGVPVLGEKPMAANMAAGAGNGRRRPKKRIRFTWSAKAADMTPGFMPCAELVVEPNWAARHLKLGLLSWERTLAASGTKCRACLLLDMAIHTLDAARYMSPPPTPSRSTAKSLTRNGAGTAGASSATALFEMTGGLRYTYRGSWSSGRPGHKLGSRLAGGRPPRHGAVGRPRGLRPPALFPARKASRGLRKRWKLLSGMTPPAASPGLWQTS